MLQTSRWALIATTLMMLPLQLGSATSLGQALLHHGSLSLLHEILQDLELLPTFEAAGNVTLLAMTDEAIVELADWGLNLSLIEPAIARAIINYHVLEGIHVSADLPQQNYGSQLAHSVLRPPVFTNVSDGPVVKLMSGSPHNADSPAIFTAHSGLQKVSRILDADILFDSGAIHTLDGNLVLPHSISETSSLVYSLHEFWRLIERSRSRELLEALRDVTVFLPDDDAVLKAGFMLSSLKPEQLAAVVANHVIPNKVLYHTGFKNYKETYSTLSGNTVDIINLSPSNTFVNNARILHEDILIYGGAAHVIDRVLFSKPDMNIELPLTYQIDWRAAGNTLSSLSLVAAVCAFGLAMMKVRQCVGQWRQHADRHSVRTYAKSLML